MSIQKIKNANDYKNGRRVIFVGAVGGQATENQVKTLDPQIIPEPTSPRVNADT